jgi:thioredoxin reductase (NADPH)
MFCNRTKEFLSQHGITFEERDVSSDEAALEELQRRSLMTTPVTLIDGKVVVGFDQAKLAELLGIPKRL